MPDTTSPKLDALTQKQRAFVLLYIGDCKFNATRSAIEAGYSENTASVIGHENLSKPQIRDAIAEQLDLAGLTPERIRSELTQMALGDIADLMPVLMGVPLDQAREAHAPTALIRKIKATRRIIGSGDDAYEVEDVTLETYDRRQALMDCAKLRGMLIEKHEHAGPGNGPIQINVTPAGKGSNGNGGGNGHG